MALRRLEGLRVAVLAADGFEQVEVTRPLKHLLRHGALADIVSLHRGKIRGSNLLAPGIKLRVNRTVDEVSASNYDALFIPGGFVNPDFLRQSEKAKMLVKHENSLDVAWPSAMGPAPTTAANYAATRK